MYAKDRITIQDRREMLRVKIKSLAEEARIIRREERRTHGPLRTELHDHRVKAVRSEARHTHLAYGYIRGRRYEQMETPSRARVPHWDSVRVMVKKFGPAGFSEPDFIAWTRVSRETQLIQEAVMAIT